MKAEAMDRYTIKIINGLVNYIVLVITILLIAFAGYALWDSSQLYQAADKSNYAAYKPTAENEGKSFKELQALNAEVFAWISVYGTSIDYPVTQGPDNMKYVNTSAEGQYSLSGSIFLDSDNSKDFSDFNSILYGHHMAKNTMFGDIDLFAEKKVFDSHRYGNMFFDNKDHGLEFFAFVHCDAYDSAIFTAGVEGKYRQAYLDGLLEKAMYKRDINVTVDDNIVLLSTCSSSSTNGRDILAGRLSDEVFAPPAPGAETSGGNSIEEICGAVLELPIWILGLALILVIRLIVYILVTYHRWKLSKKTETEVAMNG
jgi:sortase B